MRFVHVTTVDNNFSIWFYCSSNGRDTEKKIAFNQFDRRAITTIALNLKLNDGEKINFMI